MLPEEIVVLFNRESDKISGEFLEFDHVKNKLSARGDVHAFMLLDRLCPEKTAKDRCARMIGAAEHDQIWITIDADDLSKTATRDDILDLIRCGIFYDDENDCLSMFR